MSIREGYLKKWSDRKNWHSVYCKLLNNGWFQWFENASSTSPKQSVEIRRVASFLASGEPFHRVPCNPTSQATSDIPLAFGILYGPHMGTQMAWFACPDQATLSSWTNALMSLFQQTSIPPSAPPPYQPSLAPAQPPGSIGFGMPDPTAYGGNPGGYGPPPPPISQPNYGYPTNNYVPPAVPPARPAAPGAYVPGTSSYSGYQPGPQDPQGQCFVAQNGQPYQVVYVDGKPKKKKCKGLKNAAVGLASGVAGGYLASRLFGGFGGGFMGPRWGSWSSLSSLSWSD